MYKYEDIRSIHLEVTQKCQAACPMCDRNMNGKGVNPHINLDELTYWNVELQEAYFSYQEAFEKKEQLEKK